MTNDDDIAQSVTPAASPVRGSVTPPGSKSLTNRALLVAALADGPSTLTGALFSDDTHYMSQALQLAGVSVDQNAAEQTFRVQGRAGGPGPVSDRLFVGNAGTAMRFLTSYFTLGVGRIVLDGSIRMRERPIADLLASLSSLGASVTSEFHNGCPPVEIQASGLPGGLASMPGHRSSQYASSILLSAPYAASPITLFIEGKLTSQPYLDLTTDVMAAFGVQVTNDHYQAFHLAPGTYQGRQYAIEPDASAASYPLAAAAVTSGTVTVRGLSLQSRQGDIEFARILRKMGCEVTDAPDGLALTGAANLRGIAVDMNACSDVALTLAAIAPFCSNPTDIRNVGHMRLQETDRIHAMAAELARAGVQVHERKDGLTIYPSQPRATAFNTYDDHRIAMSLSILALRVPGCSILNPSCVNKTYPGFFDMLDGLVRS